MTYAMDKSARVEDLNGWFEVKGNPLSRVGIYDYSGAQIGAPAEQSDKIFKVYRPASELGAPEAIESFKLVPFIDDHTMLGEDFTSTDDRPPAGVIGETVYFEGDTLYGNPKVFSKALAQKIKSGKTELSCGYRCRYEFTPGEWNGEHYDVIQREIRGNHVALVDEGRMGPEVSILDHLTFAVDAKELVPVDEELKKMLAEILARLDKLEAHEAEEVVVDKEPAKGADVPGDATDPAADADVVIEEPVAEAADLAEEVEAVADEVAKVAGMDKKLLARIKAIPAKLKARAAMDAKASAAIAGRVKALEGRPAMDEAAVVDTLARRSSIVDKLSKHIGTFDHASMKTVDAIAAYGVEKLGIKDVAKGQELVALDAYLQAKPDPTAITTRVAQDNAAPTGLAARIASHGTAA